jgi:hypothetical protein
MACSQTSGVVRIYEIRRITPPSVVRWQPPHLAIVIESFTGIGFCGTFVAAVAHEAKSNSSREYTLKVSIRMCFFSRAKSLEMNYVLSGDLPATHFAEELGNER